MPKNKRNWDEHYEVVSESRAQISEKNQVVTQIKRVRSTGSLRVDLRLYWNPEEDGERWAPTRKGITLTENHAENILTSALEMFREAQEANQIIKED